MPPDVLALDDMEREALQSVLVAQDQANKRAASVVRTLLQRYGPPGVPTEALEIGLVDVGRGLVSIRDRRPTIEAPKRPMPSGARWVEPVERQDAPAPEPGPVEECDCGPDEIPQAVPPGTVLAGGTPGTMSEAVVRGGVAP